MSVIFNLDDLPDDVAMVVLAHCNHLTVGALACTSRRWHALVASTDDLWSFVLQNSARHPLCPLNGSWRAAFARSLFIDASWRGRRFAKKEHRHHTNFIYKVHLRGDRVLTASADESLRIFGLPPRVGRGREQHDAPAAYWEACVGQMLGPCAAVTCARFLDDQRVLSSTSASDVAVWDVSGIPLSPMDCPEASGRGGGGGAPTSARCLATHRLADPTPHAQYFEVDPSSRSIATAACEADCGVHVYDLATFACSNSLFDFASEVFAVAWADPHTVYSAFGDGKVRAWDHRTPCAAVPEYDASARGPARCLQVAGPMLLVGGGRGQVRLFDVRKGGAGAALAQRRVHDEFVGALAFDSGHGWAVTGGDDTGVALVRFPSLTEVARLSTPVGVLSLDFDHSRVVAGCEDPIMRVWDANTGEDFMDFEAVSKALTLAAAASHSRQQARQDAVSPAAGRQYIQNQGAEWRAPEEADEESAAAAAAAAAATAGPGVTGAWPTGLPPPRDAVVNFEQSDVRAAHLAASHNARGS